MGSSSLFSRSSHIVLTGALSFQLLATNVMAEIPRPFPVLGAASVVEGHWNDTPELFGKLSDQVLEEFLRFQITSAEAEQYFSIGLLDESHRAFQKLLK